MIDEKETRPEIPEVQWRGRPADDLLPDLLARLPQLRALEPMDIGFTDVIDIPVYMTLRLPAFDSVPFEDLIEWGHLDLVYTHQGKGMTPAQSQVSCLMETIERFSAGHQPSPERLQHAAFSDLGSEALNPADFYMPPAVEYFPEKRLTWLAARDLIANRDVLCPTDMALINIPDSAYPFEGFKTERLGFYLTNGLSAGSDSGEAIVSGICEAVERDAQYRIVKGLGPVPVELDMQSDPYTRTWAEWFGAKNLGLRLFHMAQIPGFHTVLAASWDPYCRLLVIGSAGGRELRFAMQQAFLEVAQQRAFMFFKRWKTRRSYFPIIRYIEENIRPESYLTEVPPEFWTERSLDPVPVSEVDEDFPWDLPSVLADLPEENRAYALDLTRPEIDLPVVRVLVSGLGNGYLDWQTGLGFLNGDGGPARLG